MTAASGHDATAATPTDETWDSKGREYHHACFIAVACGLLGIGGGFALYLLVKHQESFHIFLAGLVVAASVAWVTEYIREVIKDPRHTLAATRFSPAIVMLIVFIGMFELFIMALHHLPQEFLGGHGHSGGHVAPVDHSHDEHDQGEHDPHKATSPDEPASGDSHSQSVDATHGAPLEHPPTGHATHTASKPRESATLPEGSDVPFVRALLIAIWCVAGISVSVVLSLSTIRFRQRERFTWKDSLDALRPALEVAGYTSVVVFIGTLVITFVYGIFYMSADFSSWRKHVNGLANANNLLSLPVKPVSWVANQFPEPGTPAKWWEHGYGGAVIVIILTLAVLLFNNKDTKDTPVPLIVVGALVFVILYPFLHSALLLAPIMVMLALGLPMLVLSQTVPLLRNLKDDSGIRVLWCLAAIAVALVLAGVTAVRMSQPFELYGWMVVLAVGMIFLSFVARYGELQEYWPLLALCVALIAGGMTRIWQQAGFFGTLAQLRDLTNQQAAKPPEEFKPIPVDWLQRRAHDPVHPLFAPPDPATKKNFEDAIKESIFKDIYTGPAIEPLSNHPLLRARDSSGLNHKTTQVRTLMDLYRSEQRSPFGVDWKKLPLGVSPDDSSQPPKEPSEPQFVFVPVEREGLQQELDRWNKELRGETYEGPAAKEFAALQKRSFVHAGEATGYLDRCLKDLTDQRKRQQEAHTALRTWISQKVAPSKAAESCQSLLKERFEKLDERLATVEQELLKRSDQLASLSMHELEVSKAREALHESPELNELVEKSKQEHATLIQETLISAIVLNSEIESILKGLVPKYDDETGLFANDSPLKTEAVARRRLLGAAANSQRTYLASLVRVINLEHSKLLELCLAASLGFWVSISVLASWKLVRLQFEDNHAHGHVAGHDHAGH